MSDPSFDPTPTTAFDPATQPNAVGHTPAAAGYAAPGYAAPGFAAPAYNAVAPLPDVYDAVPPLSQGERVADTFFAPSKTFADIRRNRSWWLPFLLMAVMSVIFGVVLTHRVGVQTLAENAMKANPAQAEKMQNAPPEQRATALKFATVSMSVGLYGGAVFLLLWNAFIALLLWVGMNFILGGKSTWTGMFAVTMYAALPGLLLYVLLMVMVLVGDPETFNLANAAGTNIGYYLAPTSPAVLRSVATSLDVFTIWPVFLYGLGGAIVARLKPAKGLALTFGAWIVIVLVKAAFAAAMA